MTTQQLNHLLFTVLCFLLFVVTHAQEFSTAIYFENKDGLRDTVIVGYDSLASAGLDTIFSESDLTDQAMDTFDVRLTSVIQGICMGPDLGPQKMEDVCFFQNKYNIVPKNCNSFPVDKLSSVMQCLIPNKDLPVTIRWDRNAFNTNCLEESVITELPTENWWDILCVETYFWDDMVLSVKNEAIIEYPIGVQVYNELSDTFSLLYIGLLHEDIGSNSEEYVPAKPKIFPNPVNADLQLQGERFEQFSLYNSSGERVLFGGYQSKINMAPMQQGLYFLELLNDNGIVHTYKLIKK